MAGTRQRLLEAAGEVFARRGFRGATIREICKRAKVNVAAVNYHFRNKQQLYADVLKFAHRYAMECYPPNGGLPTDAPAEQRLQAFVRSFLHRLMDKGRPAWHGRLMIRGITEPTAALDVLVEQSIRAQFELLASIIGDLLGPDATPMQIRLCCSSIIGQCMHFQVAREVLTRLNPGLVYDASTLKAIVEHVVEFSLAGIKCINQSTGRQAASGTFTQAASGTKSQESGDGERRDGR